MSGVYDDGSEWRVKFNANGTADVKDEQISAQLDRLADQPDHPISRTKGTK